MFNKVIFAGHLGRDPELRSTQSGQPVCNFSLASSEKWTGQDGSKNERTEWASIVVWGKMAETCAQYLRKGASAIVDGRLQTRSWDDKDGKKQYKTEIVANNVRFLSKAGGDKSADSAAGTPETGGADSFDVPF